MMISTMMMMWMIMRMMLVEKNESKPEDRASPILLSFEFENVDGDQGGL